MKAATETKQRIAVFAALGVAILIVLGRQAGLYGEVLMSALLTVPVGFILYIALAPVKNKSE